MNGLGFGFCCASVLIVRWVGSARGWWGQYKSPPGTGTPGGPSATPQAPSFQLPGTPFSIPIPIPTSSTPSPSAGNYV